MKEIKKFVKWLKEKGIKRIDNFGRLLDEYEILDSAFVFDYWNTFLAELNKANITLTGKINDS